MKKILLIAFLTIGLSNIAWGGFFDSTCDAVEDKTAQYDNLSKDLKVIMEKLNKNFSMDLIGEGMKNEAQVNTLSVQLLKECKEQNYKCSVCKRWKEFEELEDKKVKDKERKNRERDDYFLKRLSGN